MVLSAPNLPGLVGRTGTVANTYPPADGRWQVAGLRELAVDHLLGFPTFTAEQLRSEAA
ncbi:hypothetical protein [Streptomyces chartreusis]|uniref:hypothetical protein n=1 Tax=Streptomyces chartreusis TaxID=1969 RepID=UPI00142EF910|nr:hypothetical protein [Streptomyces chartreusis]